MPSVIQAIRYLTAKGIRADRGYPGTPMPHITGLVVAVNIHKSNPSAVSYSAVVCVPRAMGAAACEDGGAKVAATWTAKGAVCTWGECGFDDIMDVYAITVYGRWEAPPVVPEE